MQKVIWYGGGDGSFEEPFLLVNTASFDSTDSFNIHVQTGLTMDAPRYAYVKFSTYQTNKKFKIAMQYSNSSPLNPFIERNAVMMTCFNGNNNLGVLDGPYILLNYDGKDYITRQHVYQLSEAISTKWFERLVIFNRKPTELDTNYEVPTFWYDSLYQVIWVLESTNDNVAVWKRASDSNYIYQTEITENFKFEWDTTNLAFIQIADGIFSILEGEYNPTTNKTEYHINLNGIIEAKYYLYADPSIVEIDAIDENLIIYSYNYHINLVKVNSATNVIEIHDRNNNLLAEFDHEGHIKTGEFDSRDFENKLDKNPVITGNTNTKITYDSKGLITAGENLSESDIPNISIAKVNILQETLDNKVDKIVGKGLSTEDYSTVEKNKLVTIEEGAQVNAVLSVAGRIGAITLSKADILDLLNATQTISGLMSATDKERLDVLYSLLGSEEDDNTMVDKINEVLSIFETYPEGANLVSLLASKINISDIVDNLTSDIVNKPLSANQGKILQINKLDKNTPIVGATKTKITYDENGLVIASGDLVESDIPNLNAGKITGGVFTVELIPSLPTSKITGLDASLINKVEKNTSITGATKTKITYDSKGLVTEGNDLIEADIPNLNANKITAGTLGVDRIPELLTSKITGLDSALNTKVDKNVAITGATKTKITYDAKGLVTEGTDLIEADIPNLNADKITSGVIGVDRIPSLDQSKISNLTLDLSNKVTKNNNITAATKTKITYDAKGLVTGGTDLEASDIPTISISKVTALQDTLNDKVDKITGKGLSTNDLTNELKGNYDAAHTHSTIEGNPHNTEFGELVNLPTTISGFGISDAYDKSYVDGISSNVTSLQNANMIRLIERAGVDLFKITYFDNSTSTLVTLLELKSFIGEATQELSGLMSYTDKAHLDTLVGLFEEDVDEVVNKVNEILVIFNNYPEGADLVTVLATKLDKNVAITGATKTKITYDSKGLVTGGSDLEASDIPALNTDKITSGQFGVNRLPRAESGFLKAGGINIDPSYSALSASDIPALATSKITSGTFADERISSAATWHAKVNEASIDTNSYVRKDGVWVAITVTDVTW